MAKLRYLAQAKEDLIAIKRYIANESGDIETARRFIKRLRIECQRLAELPGELGRTRSELAENLRSFPLGNYVIFFRYDLGYVEIVTITEGHRDLDKYFQDYS